MRNAGFTILVFAGLMMDGLRAMQSVDGDSQLEEARQSLTGEHKNTEKARTLLLNIVQNGTAEVRPRVLAWSYIYLGYIEDRAKNRQAAVSWYEKAVALNSLNNGSVPMGKYGIKQPLDWIRDLDAPPPQPAPKQYGKAYVTDQPPGGLAVNRNLSAEDRRENFDDLWNLIDTHYADFKLKSIRLGGGRPPIPGASRCDHGRRRFLSDDVSFGE